MSESEEDDLVLGMDLLQELHPDERKRVRDRFRLVEFSAGENIVTEGSDIGVLGIIMGAVVDLYAGETRVGQVGHGAVLGLCGFVLRRSVVLTAMAKQDGRVAILTREDVDALREEGSPFPDLLEQHLFAFLVAGLQAMNVLLSEQHVPTEHTGFDVGLLERLAERQELRLEAREVAGDRVGHLRRMPLHRPVPDASLAALADEMVVARYETGDPLCVQGEPADAVFFVCTGGVQVCRRAEVGALEVVGNLGHDRVAGLSTLVSGGVRMATLVAAEPTITLELPASRAFHLLHGHEPASEAFVVAALTSMALTVAEAEGRLRAIALGAKPVTPPRRGWRWALATFARAATP